MQTVQKTVTWVLTPTLSRRRVVVVAGVLGFTVATAAAARLCIPLPFSPVPVTMQTMVVLLAGATLGARGGAASQLLYLVLGAVGLPVFAAAPTPIGYLIGFVVAAMIVGAAARRSDRILPVGLAMAGGSVVIYVFGATWLAMVFGMTASQALAAGVLPFLPGDAIKLAGALAAWRGSAAACQRLRQ